MATKKATSTKKATVKKPVAAKTTVRTVKANAQPAPKTVAKPVEVSAPRRRQSNRLPNNIINIVFAELVGTFILTIVALVSAQATSNLYIGLAVVMLVMAIGAVSGAHINPAVTFGLWSMRKLKSILLPFYWVAQILGAMLAVIILNWVTDGSLNLDFGHFGSLNWSVLGAELVGTAVFLFGFTAAISRQGLGMLGRAAGIGLSLVAGLVVSGSMISAIQNGIDMSKVTSVEEIPHSLRVKGATLNPAVAIAQTEQTDASFTGMREESASKEFSRISWEVILGTLVGAALGGNLYLLVTGARRND